ncbi:MAG: hypothetical protein KTR31_25395, partial [Myxococcales bacterium]|nr:hypothetical protein [Myxococcales bacterium]
VVEVVEDAPGLVLGFSSFDEIATGLLVSQGVVRVVPARRGETLVQSLGEAVAAPHQPLAVSKDPDGVKRLGGGVMRVRTAVRPTGSRPVDGDVVLRTDRVSSDRAGGRDLGQGPAVTAQIRLGTDFGDPVVLGPGEVSDGAKVLAAVGYDVLFAYDLAVHPALGQLSVREAPTVQWHTTSEVSAAFAVQRFEQLEALQGPPGAARNVEVADALWFAGQTDEALAYYREAARRAAGACAPYLTLAQRELAWAGPNLATDEVSSSLTETLEAAISTPSCERATPLLIGVYRLLGEGAKLAKLQAAGDRDGSGAFMRALLLLDSDPSGAQQLLDKANPASVQPVDLQVARAVAGAGVGDSEGVLREATQVSNTLSDHPLTAAFGILSAASRLDDPVAVARSWLQAHPDDPTVQLAHSVASGKPPAEWPDRMTQRSADSPQIRCQLAVHHALSGRPGYARAMLDGRPMPTLADWWTARAVVAAFEGDVAKRSEALLNLRLRFPLAPLGYVGTSRPMGP